MQIYLIRHAIAEEREEWSGSDELRPLTAKGYAKMQEATKGLMKLAPEFDLMLTSNLVRAKQTSALICDLYRCKFSDKVRVTPALNPSSPQEVLQKEIASLAIKSSLFVVGHEPYLSTLAANLIGSSGGAILLKKGGVACLKLVSLQPELSAELCWLATPKMLKMIASAK